MAAASASVAAGLLSVAIVGRSALPRGRGFSPATVSEDVAVGLSVTVPVLLCWGLAGLPWTAVAIAGVAVVLALFFLLRPAGARSRAQCPRRESGRAAALFAEALLGACFLVACWKWFRAPLWSWDHFAIWGVKARRIVQDSALDLGFLRLRAYDSSDPGYPIGLPLAWRILSPSDPTATFFRVSHLAFALGLAAAVQAAARRLGGSRSFAALAAACVCLSPLYWDTEAVGLADLPLACLATVSLLLLLESRADPTFPAWAAGAGFGFLGWIKNEGLFLGALLVAAGLLLPAPGGGARSRRARRAPLAVAWLAWSLGAVATRRLLLREGVGFLEGRWTERVIARVPHLRLIVGAMLRNLVGTEWLGLWILFGMAAACALLRRRPLALALAGVVLCQVGLYAFVYFATYLDPVEHLQASFHRIAAALAPLAALAVVAGSRGGPTTCGRSGADRLAVNSQHVVPLPASIDGIATVSRNQVRQTPLDERSSLHFHPEGSAGPEGSL